MRGKRCGATFTLPRGALVLLIPLALITACTTETSEPTPSTSPSSTIVASPAEYRFPTDIAGDFTEVWSAAPGIDLLSRAAEIVRATGEASSIMSVPDHLNYPGAVAATAGTEPVDGWYGFGNDPSNITEKAGTNYQHIRTMSVTDTEIRATGCKYSLGLVADFPDGPLTGGAVDGLPFEIWATKAAGTTDPRADKPHGTPAGHGDRAPRYDAFGPWQVRYRTPTLSTPKNVCIPRAIEIARTIPAYADQFANRPTPPTHVTAADPNATSIPKRPQYPAWPAP